MKEYICSVCGYVHKTDGELQEDFTCPLCGAGRDAFKRKDEQKVVDNIEKPHTEKELSPMEMSIICSNLARGCEKQYMPKESENFKKLATFFRSKAEPEGVASTEKLLELIEKDLSMGFPYGNAVASEKPDRGALRCKQVFEKAGVTIWECRNCGHIVVGTKAPEVCPVCNHPQSFFEVRKENY